MSLGGRWHRHLSLERYELALEDCAGSAARLLVQARGCPECEANLAQASLRPMLATWSLPADLSRPVDWETALRRGMTSPSPRSQPGLPRALRLASALPLLAALLVAAGGLGAAGAGPDSPLYPVRGVEEEARWHLTLPPSRAPLEAELAAAYLHDAELSAVRGDSTGYAVSMARFFAWGDRLQTDAGRARGPARAQVRASVLSANASLASLAAIGADPAQLERARSLLENVEGQASGERSEGAATQQTTEATLSAAAPGQSSPQPAGGTQTSGSTQASPSTQAGQSGTETTSASQTASWSGTGATEAQGPTTSPTPTGSSAGDQNGWSGNGGN